MLKHSELHTGLYLVPTPIGNLKDITYRAVEILAQVDIILAEDTRVSKKLLQHYQITTPMETNHQYNEHKRLNGYVSRLLQGDTIALITDAGTPAISDPGFLLVRQAIKNNVRVECLPGPTSVIPALAASGLPADRFFLEGFLPRKKGREKRLKELAERKVTTIIMEAPYRIVKTLEQLARHCGDHRQACVAREISKIHEEYLRGSLKQLIEQLSQKDVIKGEMIIVVHGNKTEETDT